jgi:hypothetical protein
MHKSNTPAASPRHKKRENNGGWKRLRTWLIGVAALLTLTVVVAVLCGNWQHESAAEKSD